MSEKDVECGLGPRADPTHRSLKSNARNRDKYSGGGGKRSSVDCASPSLFPHSRHSQRKARQREGRRGGYGQREEIVGTQKTQLKSREDGRRKMSLNHLLNFTVAPRQGERGGGLSFPDPQRRRRSKTHSYNKEQFLQANCQFVVSARGDYAVHSADPDRLVDWDCIEMVRLLCHEIPSCPICLFPPRAAKITRCGHVYCWSCVLHYLSLGDKKWRKCPICYESVYKDDLKSVMALSTPQYSAGDIITMQLMVREKGTTRAVPRSQRSASDSTKPVTLADVDSHAKLVLAAPEQALLVIVEPERQALEKQLTSLSPDEASEQCFVELALEELKARELTLRQSSAIQEEIDHFIHNIEAVATPPKCRSGETQLPFQALSMALAEEYVEVEERPAFSEEEKEDEKEERGDSGHGSPLSSLSEEAAQSSPGLVSGDSPDSYVDPGDSIVRKNGENPLIYFYQAADGQHLYLHTINARCLMKEYGCLEEAPDEIKARIVEMEQLTMTEELRGRYRYISHLPVTCEFALCELELRPPMISLDILAEFEDELEWRRHKRARKKREEKRREKRAKSSQAPPDADSFPLPTSTRQLLSPERIHDLLPQLTPAHTPPSSTPPSLHPTTTSSLLSLNPVAKEFVPGQVYQREGQGAGPQEQTTPPLSESPPAPSFAEALRGKPLPLWPIRQSPKEQACARASRTPLPSGQESVEETAVPSFQEAFTEALLTTEVTTQGGHCSKKTAKKGRRKQVLFSTGGARGAHS